jgi:hypothetical protein
MFDRTPSRHGTRAASVPQLLFVPQLLLVSRAIFLLAAMSVLAAIHPLAAHGADAAGPPPRAQRHAAIVNGRHLQPTSADLSRPDMSARSAGDVDDLYRRLITPRDGR